MPTERKLKVQTAEDVKAVAKENGKELTDEQAAEILAKLKGGESGELADEDLKTAAGGYFDCSAYEQVLEILKEAGSAHFLPIE